MFIQNDDLSIYATRGDIVFFSVSADADGKLYTFKAGDVVRIKIFGKKDAETVVLEKDFPVTEDTQEVEIFLTKEDTKIGEVISKPKDYWYEVELNPHTNPQTIIGYDEDGPKIFRLFPEGADAEPFEPTEEDIPVVDDELDLTSTRPIQNQAVARAVVSLRAEYAKADEAVADIKREVVKIADRQIESEDYPGCRYRWVGGEKEWINPPLEDAGDADSGLEYRLTKRYFGKPVYVQAGTLTSIPTTSKPAYFKVSKSGHVIDKVVSVTVIAKNNNADSSEYTYPLPYHTGVSGELRATCAKTGDRTFGVFAHGVDLTGYTFTYCIEYTKEE